MDPPLVTDPADGAHVPWERGVVSRGDLRLRLPPVRGRAPQPLVPIALVFAGSFLLFLALLLPAFVAPRVARAPLAPYWQIAARGSGSYLSEARAEIVASDALQVTRTVRGDLDAGSDEVAVYDVFTALEDLRPGVPATDRVVEATDQRIALDRRSAEPVACCDERPAHEGLTVRFPFGTRRAEYPLWDDEIGAARPATFQRTDRVGGVEVYVFTSTVEPTVVRTETVAGALVGVDEPSVEAEVVYAAEKQLWVEPRTGRIVDLRSEVVTSVEPAAGGPGVSARMQLGWDADTVDWALGDTRRLASRLARVTTTGPRAALAAGAALVVAGAGLLALQVRSRR